MSRAGLRQRPKTHTDEHMKETNLCAHTESQREIMHLLIMGVVRRDGEELMNAFMCSGEMSEMHVDRGKDIHLFNMFIKGLNACIAVISGMY